MTFFQLEVKNINLYSTDLFIAQSWAQNTQKRLKFNLTLVKLGGGDYTFVKAGVSEGSGSLVLTSGVMHGKYMLVVDVRGWKEKEKELLVLIKAKANVALTKLTEARGFINLKKAFTDHMKSQV